jgi:hypothetical protein
MLTSFGVGLNLHMADGWIWYYMLARSEPLHLRVESLFNWIAIR